MGYSTVLFHPTNVRDLFLHSYTHIIDLENRTTLVAVILDYLGLYCESSWSPGWGYVYVSGRVEDVADHVALVMGEIRYHRSRTGHT